MATRVCLSCKEDVKGFVFCPKCGGRTELIETQENKLSTFVGGGSTSASSSQLAMWCHLAPLLIGVISFLLAFVAVGFILILFAWVPPLILRSKNPGDRNIVRNANESLNFQLFWLISSAVLLTVYLILGVATLGIGLIVGGIAGLFLIFPVLLFILISQIRATSAASAGRDFRYPLVLFRILKD
jgi:uncharacterized Tic20 family protein